MDYAEAGDEAADERIVSPEADREVLMQPWIHRPDASPRDDGEEESGLEAVEGEEEGDGHGGILAEGVGSSPSALGDRPRPRHDFGEAAE